MTSIDRREFAYWLALAFHLPRERVHDRNMLVLEAARAAKLSLLELVACDTEELPASLQAWAPLHARLLEAEGRVSAQAFVVDRMAQAKLALLPITHPDYPGHLLQRLTPRRAPTLLSVAGDIGLLREPGVAISGSRDAGPEGRRFARMLARALAEAGHTVVSGLARGVDTEALEGALEAGGRVIGVSPTGIFKSPALRRRELQEGRLVVISEFEPAARWAGWAAMKRNSTIAGMSRALFIADCVAEGGTTAQFDVHRDLGLPVYIRRGPGEGRLMAELAARPGAHPIRWAQGFVMLPDSLRHAAGPPARLRCSVWREGGRLHVSVDAPEGSELDEILAAVRAQLQGQPVKPKGRLSPYVVPETASIAEEGNSAPSLTADPVLKALAGMDGQQGTVSDLSERLGWSKSKLRKKLKSLAEAEAVAVERSERPYTYSLVAREQAPRATTKSRAQLELLSS